LQSFFDSQFGYAIFVENKIATKVVHKMLLKLIIDVQLAEGARGREGEPAGLRGESDVDDVERCDAERHVKPEKCDVS